LGAVYRAVDAVDRQPVVFPRAQRRTIDGLLGWIGAKVDAAPADTPLLSALNARYAALSPKRRRRAVIAEYSMLFVAGVETTAGALTYAIAEIAADPALRDRVAAEARQSGAEIAEPAQTNPAAEPLAAQSPTISNVIQEALRRHTLLPTMLREAEASYDIPAHRPGSAGGATHARIPRGTILRYLPVLSHTRRSVWNDPYRFSPDRFERGLNPEQLKHYHPFGMGPQSCIGRSLATTEMLLILRAMFKRLHVELSSPRGSIPVARTAVFTVRPLGVHVLATPADGAGSVRSAAPSATPRGTLEQNGEEH